MAAQVMRRMSLAKASILIFVLVALLTTLFMVKMSQGQAAPGSPTDSTAVPHYYGPWPNWALSPLTLPDATVTITGDGTGATATATVGGNGAVTGITVDNPGNGYTSATVDITGAGTGAGASATITNSGVITAVTVTASGSGFKSPTAAISGGGATTDATATAYGSVDAVTLQNAGTGYQFPTVAFDMPDDPNGTQATAHAEKDGNGAITAIVIDDPGTGYMNAPGMVIRDGTLMDPVANAGAGASAVCTIKVTSVTLETFGAGYTSAPLVTITDATGNGTGATADATVDAGAVTTIDVTAAGTGYVTGGGIKKFQDQLPMLCDPAVPGSCPTGATDKYLPLGVPQEKTYDDPDGQPIKADEYEIGLVQYRTKFNTDLPATLVRAYVQLESPSWVAAHPGVSQHVLLENELRDGTKVPIMIDGQQAYGVTTPQWLGPVIGATKDKPVRIVFRNLLPTGTDGDLFIPVDSTLMGSGMGPMGLPDPVDEGSVLDEVRNPICTEAPKSTDCFKDNRATLHLHGGISPWISDGTPHQWITPAGEDTPWPEGVDVRVVPDMSVGQDPKDGVMTFYYTNQQSARLMFYHDHAWGITRLNVYAGEAAGYLISDNTEQKLISSGTIPADQIPLIVQDRTFVPQDEQLYDVDGAGNVDGSPGFDPATNGIKSYGQDPTWDKSRWGGYGDFWYQHVYMPAQNPGSPNGLSAVGRWMYGPWFWPPASDTIYGPIDNPYYDPNCKLGDPATWQYDVDPFCEPQKIPGTPNISNGMEQFNDTPTVNGVAYPEITLQPKSYRFRFLNAANDRFFNFQWYVADPSTGTDSEVALDPLLLAQAQTDPVVFPTPVHNASTDGPDWIVIGSEGGFLPAPVVVDGQQETTWITDPTRFDVGNVDKHSLVIAPAERSDVIVDFSKFAGKTLIMYNDAPAAYPARVPSYDYYTGAPDQSPAGAPMILPGYGPNTRTIMRVTIAAAAPAPAFNLNKLRSAFVHKADGSGVFESGQHPIIVGQKAYNSAYGTAFATGGTNCNPVPNDGEPRLPDLRRVRARQRHAPVRLQHARQADHQDDHAAAAEGHPRRDERHHLRRLRPHAGQPRRGGAAADAGPAERHALPVREPGDGDHQRHRPAQERRRLRRRRQRGERHHDRADDRREGRYADLAHHPQRRGHAPHPLPPVRRADPRQGDVGRHHHRDRARGAGLEGHRPGEPARGHHRRPAADRASGAVRGDELHPQHEPDGPGGVDQPVQQHRPRRYADQSHRQPAGQLRLAVRLALPHPEPRRDGHDAAAVAGAPAGGPEQPDQHARGSAGGNSPGIADLERQLDH